MSLSIDRTQIKTPGVESKKSPLQPPRKQSTPPPPPHERHYNHKLSSLQHILGYIITLWTLHTREATSKQFKTVTNKNRFVINKITMIYIYSIRLRYYILYPTSKTRTNPESYNSQVQTKPIVIIYTRHIYRPRYSTQTTHDTRTYAHSSANWGHNQQTSRGGEQTQDF